MTAYLKSGNAFSLNRVHSYAASKVNEELHSSLYSRLPLLAYLAGKTRAQKGMREAGLGLLTGARVDKVMQETEAFTETHDRFQTATVGGGKWMGTYGDTAPSTGAASQSNVSISATHRWARFYNPLKIDRIAVLMSKGNNAKIASVIDEGRRIAQEDTLTSVHAASWYGNPADQSADTWNTMMGILPALDTDNTYGNVNRSTYSAWVGKRVTTAKAPSLSLIDDANSIQGTAHKGPGIDFALTSPAIYNALKQEALARGQVHMIGEMPGAPEVGATQECIKYGKTTITYDPVLSGTDWSAYDSDVTDNSKLFVGFTTEDWVFSAHPEENFTLTEMQDLSLMPGGEDVLYAQVRAMVRLRCKKPWRSIVYTAVA